MCPIVHGFQGRQSHSTEHGENCIIAHVDRTDDFGNTIIENSKLRIRYRTPSLNVYTLQTSKPLHVSSSAFVQ